MKTKKFLLPLILLLCLGAAGCTEEKQQPVYSSLSEESIRYDLDSLFERAGVSDERRYVFFRHVDQFLDLTEPDQRTEGFIPVDGQKSDNRRMEKSLQEQYGDFSGYNSRITAFSLYEEGHLTVGKGSGSGEGLEEDLKALEKDPSALPSGMDAFLRFYSPVITEDEMDAEYQAEKLLEAWEDRGIRFREDPYIRMINLVLLKKSAGKSTLFVEQSGILLPTPDGDLWFVEKPAFSEPYRLVSFRNRSQLRSYLLENYGKDPDGKENMSFILENDSLLKT